MRRTAATFVLLLAATIAVVSLVEDHGTICRIDRDAPPYRVTFYSVAPTTTNETVRFFWQIVNASTGNDTGVGPAVLNATFYDANETRVDEQTIALLQETPGWLHTDLKLGDAGRVALNVAFENVSARFNQKVHDPNIVPPEAYQCPAQSGNSSTTGLPAPPIPLWVWLVVAGVLVGGMVAYWVLGARSAAAGRPPKASKKPNRGRR